MDKLKEVFLKRKSKDSVFKKLFEDVDNVLRLYKDLHPDDKDITTDDIDILTLETIIMNNMYNDLGFLAKNKCIMLFEAQSRWDLNIAFRIFMYLAQTLLKYIIKTKQSMHQSHKIYLPKPELYVIYSGSEKHPEILSLSNDFFEGSSDIELKVRVISGADKETIFGQYLGFCKIMDECRKALGNTSECVKEIYKRCIEEGYLAEFMKAHETEVIDMFDSLFDKDFLLQSYITAECAEAEARAEAKAKAEAKAEAERENEIKTAAEVEKARVEAEAKAKLESEASAKARENEYVLKLLAMNVMSNKDISNVIGIPIGRVEELSKQLIADS